MGWYSRLGMACATGMSMLLLGGAASATTIQFETDQGGNSVVAGTAIGETYAYLGAHFFGAFFQPCSACPVPTPGHLAAGQDYTAPISVVFDTVTNFISVENVSDSSWIMDAFDNANNYLGSLTSSSFPDTQELTLPGILSISFRPSGPDLLYGFDNLTFFLNDRDPGTDVPEPAAAALLALGLGACAWAHRRQRADARV